MTLARLCLRSSPLVRGASTPLRYAAAAAAGTQPRILSAPSSSHFSSSSAASPEDDGARDVQAHSGSEVAVSEGRSTSSPSRRRGRRHGLMRRFGDPNWDIAPFDFNRGLTNALTLMAENLSKLLELPSRLPGPTKEDDSKYEVQLDVPGLTKEELKIFVENGFLVITGEHKEEEGSEDDEAWRARRYRYHSSSLALPEDAKVEDIKAELNHGVLRIVIPRDENQKRAAKEVEIH